MHFRYFYKNKHNLKKKKKIITWPKRSLYPVASNCLPKDYKKGKKIVFVILFSRATFFLKRPNYNRQLCRRHQIDWKNPFSRSRFLNVFIALFNGRNPQSCIVTCVRKLMMQNGLKNVLIIRFCVQ